MAGTLASYLRPTSLQDALAALASQPRAIVAGGTDHFPSRVVHSPDEDILDIGAIDLAARIARRGDGWWIPCGATWTDVIEADLPPLFDGLVAAARQVGGPQIQNAGTVVGNVCNASPAADGGPCLLALDASIELASISGTRLMRLEEFLLGPRRTARRPDALATGRHVRDLGAVRSTFAKLGGRRHLVISIAMLATVARLADDGAIADIRIALGACGPVSRRLRTLEADLVGRRPHADLIRPEHLKEIAPIDDIRGTAAYRRAAALELLRRAIAALGEPRAVAA